MEKNGLHEDNSKTMLTQYGFAPSTKWTQYFGSILATIAALIIGTHLSWSSSAVPTLTSPNSTLLISEYEGSWVGSIITLGACVGAIPTGSMTNWIGRKRTLQLLTIPLLVSWYIIAFSPNVWGLYIARFLAGIGCGAACVASLMYVTELAEPKNRGTLGTFFQLQMTVGFLLGYTLGGTIESISMVALISSAFPVLFLLTFSFMPESPVYLALKCKTNEARESLLFFRGADYNVDDELTTITDNIQSLSLTTAKFSDLYANKAVIKAMVIALALMFFQQLSGINAVLFNALEIFQQSGTTLSPNVCTIISGAVQVIATYVATVLIDKAGRRILLVLSGGIMSVCLATLAVYYYLQQQQYDLSCFYFVPLSCVAVYLIVFSIGLGPIPWMIAGDVFLPQVKGLACSVSTTFNWILAFTVTKLFLPVQSAIGIGFTFGIFAIICVCAAVFTIFVIPETKGKTLEEVQILLAGEEECNSYDNCVKITV
ncbi:hypothetical protein RN001_011699 [Aquatica leii]|uniref:Major facilitator superfamily (MFS) profile domain-containing protein n=1 Tax=Aquatica leii TaxID=1421715 RepID=A0AAN7P2R6_9COLE|nr:hypothetical protein RN001_011699 [Aquatica leii]